MDGDETTLEQLTQLAALVCEAAIGVVRELGDDTVDAVEDTAPTPRTWWWTRRALTPHQQVDALALGARLTGDELVVVPDAQVDARLADGARLHGELALRFVAGLRLRTADGRPVAQLLVLDDRAHELAAQHRLALGLVGRQIVQALARRHGGGGGPPGSATADSFFALDRDGAITYMNDRAAALIGRTAAAMIGKNLWAELPALIGGPLHQPIQAVLHDRQPRQYEAFAPLFQRWFETRIYPTADGGVVVFSLDIDTQRQAAAAERVATTQLRALSERLISVREDEAARLAREIHDGLGQPLTALKLDLSWLATRGASGADLGGKLPGMLELVDEMFATIRRMSADLRPSLIDDLGLAAATEWLVGEFGRRTGLAATAVVPPDDPPLARTTALALYRIVQEALGNVARHAGAGRVEVRLEVADGQVRIDVTDDGRGIRPDEATSPTSIGLVGMRERAALIGGEVHVGAAPGGGTRVAVRAPVTRG